MSPELGNRLRHVHAVALIVQAQDRPGAPALQSPQSFGHPSEAIVAVGILLSKDRDLTWPKSPHPDQISHDSFRFLRIAGAIVENVAVGRNGPEKFGARERSEEQQLVFESVRECDGTGWGSHVADEAQNLVLFVELPHRFGGSARLIAVIRRDQFQLSAMDPTSLVGAVEGGLDAKFHLSAEFSGRSREGS